MLAFVALSLAPTPGDASDRRRGGHRVRTRVFIGAGPVFWYGPHPYWWYRPRPYYAYPHYVYPPPVVVQEPPVYIQAPPPATAPPPQQPQQSQAEGYWYYCSSAKAYYPTVASCSEPWIKVPPRND
jgi:hypothetical protein